MTRRTNITGTSIKVADYSTLSAVGGVALVTISGIRTGALDTLANYTLGSGFTFRAAARRVSR